MVNMNAEIKSLYRMINQGEISQKDAVEQIKKIRKRYGEKTENTSNVLFELSDLGEVVFSRSYMFNDDLLKDHQLYGEQLLMGLAHCSLVFEALQPFANSSNVTLKDVSFRDAIKFSPSETISVDVLLKKKDDLLLFENKYFKESSQQQVITASGEVSLAGDDSAVQETVDIEKWIKHAVKIVSTNDFYHHSGADIYGDSLMSVHQVHLLEQGVLGEIELTPAMKKESAEYVLHPAILDAMHVTASYSVDADQPWNHHWVPFVIKCLQIKQLTSEDIESRLFCHVDLKQSNSEIKEYTCKLYNSDGLLLVSIDGLYTKRVPSRQAMFGSASAIVETSTINVEDTFYTPTNVDPVSLQERIQHYLILKVSELVGTPQNEIGLHVHFMDLGADSRDLTVISQKLEEESGVKLLPTVFFEYQNIEELSEFFSQQHTKSFASMLDKNESSKSSIASSKTAVAHTPEKHNKQKDTLNSNPQSAHSVDTGEEIAIIGMHGRLADSTDLQSFWKHIHDADDLITEIPASHWDFRPWFDKDGKKDNKTYSKWGSFLNDVDKFDPLFFGIPPRQAIWMDPQARMLLEVVNGVFEDAGVCNSIKGSKTGVYTGVCFQEYWDEIVRKKIPMTGYESISSQMSSLSGQISYTFDLQGPSIPLDNACASSLTAMHLACHALKSGDCEQAIVAGMNLLLSPLHYVYSSQIKSLSPTGRCHTFDKQADGYVPGEGIVAVMLKPLSKAIEDGDNIHAVIKGTAINHVGRSNNPTAPRPELQTKMLLDAWDNANISADQLSYIECHGTGTQLGDPIEISALSKAFRQHTQKTNFCAIGSTKAHIGHLEGAAGLASVIKVVLSMQHRSIPKMPNFTQLNPAIQLDESPFYINTQVQPWVTDESRPCLAGVSSFGMTGNNAHVVIEEYIPETVATADLQIFPVIIVLSARNAQALNELVLNLLSFINDETCSDTLLMDIAYTLQVGREAMEERLALVVESIDDLIRILSNYCQGHQNSADTYQAKLKINHADFHKTDPVVQNEIRVSLENNRLSKIAEYWVNGESIHWQDLYQDLRPRRISLPTYPFAKERYWIPDTGDVDSGTNVDSESNSAQVSTDNESIIRDSYVDDSKNNRTKGIQLRSLSTSQSVPRSPSTSFDSLEKPNYIADELKISSPSSIQLKANNVISSADIKLAISTTTKQTTNIPVDTLIEELAISLAQATFMKRIDIDIDRSFVDLGLDSIIGVEWIGAINKQYGLSTTATRTYDYPTIREFARFLHSELSKADRTDTSQVSVKNSSILSTMHGENPEPLQDSNLTAQSINDYQTQSHDAETVVTRTHESIATGDLVQQLTASLAVATFMKQADIDIDKSFVDLGLDSIIGVEWIGAINKQYEISITATKTYDYPTIREFAGFLQNELNVHSQKSVATVDKSSLSLDELLLSVQNGTLEVAEADELLDQLSV